MFEKRKRSWQICIFLKQQMREIRKTSNRIKIARILAVEITGGIQEIRVIGRIKKTNIRLLIGEMMNLEIMKF